MNIWMDDWKKLNETLLKKEDFYSYLNKKDINKFYGHKKSL